MLKVNSKGTRMSDAKMAVELKNGFRVGNSCM